MGSAWAVVVAGGSGSRFGGLKQFEDLAGRRVVDWSLAAARAACDGVVLVVPAGVDEPGAVTGGATRSGSVRAGLAAVPDDADVVLVHDAARPLAGAELFTRAAAAVRAGADGAVPVVPVTDTVKRVEHRLVVETLDRSTLVAVQTPQAFDARMLREAHAAGGDATDDAGLVESIGGKVVAVDGDRWNLKLTTPEDLVVMEALLVHRGRQP
jgi:2-C-methyl-D-erythritol 4-phosphate cytidylyltransferase